MAWAKTSCWKVAESRFEPTISIYPWVRKTPWRRKMVKHSSIPAWRIPIHGVAKAWDMTGQLNINSSSKTLVSSVQSPSHVWLCATPWNAARQASLSITNSLSLLKLVFIKSVMPSNRLIFCHPLLLPSIFPSIRVFSNESFASGGQSIGVSASSLVLPMNIQDWFPLW